MGKFIDLTGQKYGRLTVIKLYGRDNRNIILWLCECDCGSNKEIIVRTADLKNGHTQSCGCLRNEINSDRLKKQNKPGVGKKNKLNKYEKLKKYIIGYASNTHNVFFIDLEDYNKIKNHTWFENEDGYLLTRINYKLIRMHRLIMKIDDSNFDVDHINHDTLDNRKINLRIVNRSQNNMNRNSQGVFWIEERNKWMAYITKNYKRKFLGHFNTYEEAVKARKEAEEKLFKEYSYDNSQIIAKQNKL